MLKTGKERPRKNQTCETREGQEERDLPKRTKKLQKKASKPE